MPKAGHFKRRSSLPSVNDQTFNDCMSIDTAVTNLLVADNEEEDDTLVDVEVKSNGTNRSKKLTEIVEEE